MKIAARCDVGMLRKVNQDSIYYNDQGIGVLPNLMIVADGMGGHQAGEKASQLAVSGMVDQILAAEQLPEDPAGWLADCAGHVNEDILALSESTPEWKGMGTTLVTAVCIQDTLYCINVGDSRLYVMEQMDNASCRLRKITEDHSIVEEMVKNGALTPEEARVHPKKNLITRAVGLEHHVKVDQFAVSLTNIRMILVCSDGLSNMISEKEILKNMLLGDGNPDSLADKLKNMANANGGYDNISVIIADMRGE